MGMRSLLALAFALTACVQPTADTDDGRPGGNNTGGNNTGGDSCAEIVECMDACETDACANACFDSGSSDAQQQIIEISDCFTSCSDNTCTRCNGLLDQCFADTGGDGPQGSMLPPSIVGDWSEQSFSGNNGSLITFTFTADGRVNQLSTLQFNDIGGGCNVFQTEYDGVVQLSGNLMNITVIDGSFTEHECGSTETTNSGPHEEPESYRVTTGVDAEGDFLELEDVSNGIAVTYHRT